MKKFMKLFVFLFITFILISSSFSATWGGGGSDHLASTPANWTENIMPSYGVNIIFDTTSSKNCTWDLNQTYTSLTIGSGYTGTVMIDSTLILSRTLIIADHTAAMAGFNSIPTDAINTAKSALHIAYGHTSHGSQLITGMDALNNADGSGLYSWNHGGTGGALDLHDYAMGGDVGYYPDWVNNTRAYLGTPNASGKGTTNPDVNVIIWSWCGQAGYADMTEGKMISNYLAPMTQLEADYPGIKFVYMTGHLDGSGSAGNLNVRNQQIRDYCTANNKILFDFADIESYDPGGLTNYMALNATDNCDYDGGHNWASEWLTANPGHELTHIATTHCGSCQHSQTLNCVLKGRAIWWLWARLAGWNP